jgi:Transposase DDE domain
MSDTAANQAAYPQPNTQAEGLGFPIARVVALIACATGVVLDIAVGPYSGKGTGVHALFRELMGHLHPGDILLGDCYYPSYFVMACLMAMGVDGLFPMHAGRGYDFRRGKKLGQQDHLVDWVKPAKPSWMEPATYEQFPDAITVREVSVTLEKKGFRTKPRILVKTFIDASEVSKADLANLYDTRWFVEICFKAIKETLGMDILRAKKPEMIRKEIWSYLLAYNLIRKMIAQASHKHSFNPRQISFKLALQLISEFVGKCLLLEGSAQYDLLLKSIVSKRVGNRPGRSEPRCVKRRPKAFPRLKKTRNKYHQRKVA